MKTTRWGWEWRATVVSALGAALLVCTAPVRAQLPPSSLESVPQDLVLPKEAESSIDQRLPVPPPGLGELSEVIALTNRTSRIRQELRALTDAPYFCIRVNTEGTFPGAAAINPADVTQWAVEELARTAPRAKILGAAEQAENAKKIYPPTRSALDFLFRTDGSSRFLEIKLIFRPNTSGNAKDSIICHAGANFWRPAIQPTGFFFYMASIDMTSTLVPKGEEARIKEAVQRSVRRFAEKWNLVNKPGATPPVPQSPSAPAPAPAPAPANPAAPRLPDPGPSVG